MPEFCCYVFKASCVAIFGEKRLVRMFWRYFQHHVKDGLGVGETKQRIADEFGWTFDRVDKVINRKWDKVFAEKSEQYEATWKSLQDKS